MSSESTIQVIEQEQWEPVVCPFCGFVCYPGADDEEWQFDRETSVCDHTLFVATDYGFEYRSHVYNAHMGFPDNQDAEPRLPDEYAANYDAFTSRVAIPGAVKISAYTPAPSFMGIYYGFAPEPAV